MSDCDLLILGGGPAGYSAALLAAARGRRVTLIDRETPGGTCLHRGCIPTKALVGAGRRWRFARGAAAFGLPVPQGEPDFAAVLAAGAKAIGILAQGLKQQLLRAGVTIVTGSGALTGPRTVTVDGTTCTGAALLIATGSRPLLPRGFVVDAPRLVSSDEVWRWERLPRRLLVVGGGVIGCEFASALAALGAQVTVVEMGESLLPGLDTDLASGLARCFRKEKIAALTATTVADIARDGDGVRVQLRTASGESDWQGDAVLLAAGRQPVTDIPGLTDHGCTLAPRGGIVTDDCLRAGDGIWAAGDVRGGIQLAHVAAEEGETAVENILGGAQTYDAATAPWALFTEPEIGSVGLSEQAAHAAHGDDVVTGTVPVRALGRAQATGELDGVAKVVARRDGTLLGVHLLGARATDLVAAGACALRAGMTVTELAETVQAHPTFAEGLRDAARAAARA